MSVVLDPQADTALLDVGREPDLPPLPRRVDRVQDEVEHDLHQAIADGPDGGEVVGKVGRDRPFLRPLIVLGDPQSLVDHVAQADAGGHLRGRPREVDQLADGPLDAGDLPVGQVELVGRVRVGVAAAEHLEQRAECGQRVSHLVSDPRRQEAESGHLLLVDHAGLRRSKGFRPLGHPLLQLRLMFFQGRVRPLQPRACRLEQAREGRTGPGGPCQDDDRHADSRQLYSPHVQSRGEQDQAQALDAECDPGDRRPIPDGAAGEREQVIPAEGAIEADVVVAEHRDERGLHRRNEQRPALEEDLAHSVEGQVERRVAGAEGEKCPDGGRVVEAGPGLDQDVAHRHAEDADLQRDRLRGELPGEAVVRRLGVHGSIITGTANLGRSPSRVKLSLGHALCFFGWIELDGWPVFSILEPLAVSHFGMAPGVILLQGDRIMKHSNPIRRGFLGVA